MAHEIDELKLEKRRLLREIFWYPVGVAAALITSIAVVVTAIYKAIGLI